MTTIQDIYKEIETLPPESLVDLAEYITFLRFRRKHQAALSSADVSPGEQPLRIVHLRGILSGSDFSPELLHDTRREMWHKFKIEES